MILEFKYLQIDLIGELQLPLIMKLLNVLALAGLATACSHDHDDKEWTKEELDELEQKWGYEVCDRYSVEKAPSVSLSIVNYRERSIH